MAAYILRRLLLIVPTLFGVLLLNFVVVQFVPGGPAEQLLSQLTDRESRISGGPTTRALDPKQIAEIKALYGFDKPAPERFWQMLGQFARFD
ncbi:MAG: microcin ABC transporter permease, partial [Variovorax sp.]